MGKRGISIPLRAHLVARAEEWRWSSLRPDAEGLALDPGPVPRGADWMEFVNTPMTEAEVAAIRPSLRWDRPYGTDSWTTETAGRLGLEVQHSTARPTTPTLCHTERMIAENCPDHLFRDRQ